MTKSQAIDYLKPIIDRLRVKHYWINGKASMVMAQILVESGWLRHAPGNNCLGIKVPKNKIGIWKNVQLLKTKEWENGKYVDKKCWFMTYESIEDCIESGYIKTLSYPRYKDTRDSIDWFEATNWIRINGYATSPSYTQTLRNTILSNKLYEIDFRHDPEEKITADFKYRETFSNVRIGNRTYYRVIENPPKYDDNRFQLAIRLQNIRDLLSKPIVITDRGCWYRQPSFNALAGGLPDSQHLTGEAADVYTPRGYTGHKLYLLFKAYTDIERYGIASNWLHVDIDKNKPAIWYY